MYHNHHQYQEASPQSDRKNIYSGLTKTSSALLKICNVRRSVLLDLVAKEDIDRFTTIIFKNCKTNPMSQVEKKSEKLRYV